MYSVLGKMLCILFLLLAEPAGSLAFDSHFTLFSGKDKVWCLYPNKNAPAKSVKDSMAELSFSHVECPPETVRYPYF